MKELSIQEKAQRYDKAIEIARYYYNDRAMPIGTNFKIERMFPELIENEDEVMRAMAIKAVYAPEAQSCIKSWGINPDDVVAWLEKQNSNVDDANKEYWRGYREGKQEILDKYAEVEKQGEQKPSMEGTFVNVDEVREDFMQEVYRVLDADTTNDRANQIIDAFDNLPTIAIQKPANNVEPIFRVGDYIRNKKTGDKVLIVQVDVAEKAYCYVNYDGAAVNHSEFLFVEQDEWELLGYKVTEPKLAEDSVKISESSTEEKDMTEYKKGFECGKQRVLKYPEDFGLCKKPDYKLDPKFKPGDWIITPDKKIKQIEYISFANCRFTDGSLYNVIDVVNKAHLWTIQDAKAGDVLETTNYVYIFHSIDKETETVSFYCLMKKSDEHFSFGDYKIHYEILKSTPATQEQCDLLFKKMKEEGYKWDAEKKLVDKIEPKFKVEAKFHEGEWITNGDYTWKILMVKFMCYVLQSQGGNVVEDTIPHVDEQFHSFTIEDAKTGDVLASELCDSIILFKGINDDNNIDFYCDYYFSEIDVPGDRFSVNNGQHYGNVEDSKDFHPATKERRDILMKAMADAGYAFDFKKLELKKIVVPIFNIGDTIVEKDLDECSYGTIKDIKNGQYIFTDGSSINIDEQEEWQLKTSTNIEQKPADWSEEDEKMLNQIVSIIEDADDRLIRAENISIYTNWLKSLKPKYQWKPTIRELTALEYAVNDNTLSCDELYTLNELYEQLKKL